MPDFYALEDGSGVYVLEDGSGFYLLENSTDVAAIVASFEDVASWSGLLREMRLPPQDDHNLGGLNPVAVYHESLRRR